MFSMLRNLLRFSDSDAPQPGDVPVFNGRGWHPQPPAAGAVMALEDFQFLGNFDAFAAALAADTVSAANNAVVIVPESSMVRLNGWSDSQLMVSAEVSFVSKESLAAATSGRGIISLDLSAFATQNYFFQGCPFTPSGWRDGTSWYDEGFVSTSGWSMPVLTVSYPIPKVFNGAAADVPMAVSIPLLFAKVAP